MLFARGADIRQGQLLHNAVLRDGPEHEVIELVELLLGKGATINEIQYENHPQTFAELQDFSLGTPLHYAAQAGKEMVVSYLLNKGADPLIRNTKGRTVIEAAGHTNQSAVVQHVQGLTSSFNEVLLSKSGCAAIMTRLSHPRDTVSILPQLL
jgi:hypothetical protein